jgi:hypothetical protein
VAVFRGRVCPNVKIDVTPAGSNGKRAVVGTTDRADVKILGRAVVVL